MCLVPRSYPIHFRLNSTKMLLVIVICLLLLSPSHVALIPNIPQQTVLSHSWTWRCNIIVYCMTREAVSSSSPHFWVCNIVLYLQRTIFLECRSRQRTCFNSILLVLRVSHIHPILKRHCVIWTWSQMMTKYPLLYTTHHCIRHCSIVYILIPSHVNIHHCTKNRSL